MKYFVVAQQDMGFGKVTAGMNMLGVTWLSNYPFI